MQTISAFYFFYDWKVLIPNCQRFSSEFTIERSDNPQADFVHDAASGSADQNGYEVNFNAQNSTGGSRFRWDFGDGNTINGDSVTHTYTQNGTFEVRLIVENSCGADTLIDSLEIHGVHVDKHASMKDLAIYPNPSNGQFTLRFHQVETSDLTLELMDISGKAVWRSFEQNFIGSFEREFDIHEKASGVYLLRITNNQGQITKKLIVK